MSHTPTRIEQCNLMLVEGKDEEGFFKNLLAFSKRTDIQIINFKGVPNLKGTMMTLVKTPGFKDVTFIAIVRDTDSNPKGAFVSLCSCLVSAGLEAPNAPFEPKRDCRPSVAILLLPSESDEGELEDVCLKSFQDDKAFPCVEKYFDCLTRSGVDMPAKLSKAKVQAFLASRKVVDFRLGIAADKGYIDFDHEAFAFIRKFIEQIPAAGAFSKE